jgi:hypothetical protein
MEAREFTDGELEFAIETFNGVILTLEGNPRPRQKGHSNPFEFEGLKPGLGSAMSIPELTSN